MKIKVSFVGEVHAATITCLEIGKHDPKDYKTTFAINKVELYTSILFASCFSESIFLLIACLW
jgi:hypothetical protein